MLRGVRRGHWRWIHAEEVAFAAAESNEEEEEDDDDEVEAPEHEIEAECRRQRERMSKPDEVEDEIDGDKPST